MGECFWEQESVIGLTRECTGGAPVESPWAYITTPPPEAWTPQPGGTYKTLGFPLEGALADVTTATLTGVKIARAHAPEADDEDTGVMVSSADDPSAVDYTAVSAPAILGGGAFGAWMYVESWLSPPLADYGYAIVACRWDTNIGVIYTLSYRSAGV